MKPRPRFTLKAILWLMLIVGSHGCYREHQEREAVAGQPNDRQIDNKATVIDPPIINVPFNEKMTALGAAVEFTTYALRKRYTSKITEADLFRCPNWTQDAESPPLSARKAIGLATKMKDSLVKDDQRCKWLLASLELRPTRSEQWVWVARYLPIFPFGYVASAKVATAENLAIVVMMDGTVIKPKVSDWTNDGEPREAEVSEGEEEPDETPLALPAS